jgi:hypothetical protein
MTAEMEEWNAGFGQGTCPMPPSFEFQGQVMVYDWTPACDAASWIKPIVIGLAMLTAAYIVMGVREGG